MNASMKAGIALLVGGLAMAGCASTTEADLAAAAATTAYVDGAWYDGERFVARAAYVRDGAFVDRPRSAPGRIVSLAGGFATPAFAEGHHHTVICDPERIGQFVDAGILYAAIMAAAISREECKPRLHGDGSVEVVTALASITAPDAHPTQIGLYWLEPEQVEGEWVYHADDPGDLDGIFARIAQHRPDFIKIILSYSEDHERLRDDETMSSWYRGLNPTLAPLFVERAHAMGLRVAAHVMSGHDFAVAVSSGVDIIAHMPGFAPGNAFPAAPHPYLDGLPADAPRYRIARADAERAAQRNVVVVTTLGASVGPSAHANVALLREAGVPLLIGSDRGEGNSVDEAVDLVNQGLMPAGEVVQSLAVTTPQYFFPNRRVGDLRPGFEATFVVLRADPTRDIANLRAPQLVVQRGVQLRPAP